MKQIVQLKQFLIKDIGGGMMVKLSLTAVFILILCGVVMAEGYETKIVFVPEHNSTSLEDSLRFDLELRYKEIPNAMKMYMDLGMKKIRAFTYDLNELTKEGWEIKDSRRVWIDIDYDDNPDYYEWGTEYTLQRRIQEKKKGWLW